MYFPFLELHEWVKISTAQPKTIYSVFPSGGDIRPPLWCPFRALRPELSYHRQSTDARYFKQEIRLFVPIPTFLAGIRAFFVIH